MFSKLNNSGAFRIIKCTSKNVLVLNPKCTHLKFPHGDTLPSEILTTQKRCYKTHLTCFRCMVHEFSCVVLLSHLLIVLRVMIATWYYIFPFGKLLNRRALHCCIFRLQIKTTLAHTRTHTHTHTHKHTCLQYITLLACIWFSHSFAVVHGKLAVHKRSFRNYTLTHYNCLQSDLCIMYLLYCRYFNSLCTPFPLSIYSFDSLSHFLAFAFCMLFALWYVHNHDGMAIL